MSYYYATVGDPARHATTTCSITPLTTLNARHDQRYARLHATPCAITRHDPCNMHHYATRSTPPRATTPRHARLRHYAPRKRAITRH